MNWAALVPGFICQYNSIRGMCFYMPLKFSELQFILVIYLYSVSLNKIKNYNIYK
jgi:hypothetical protein